MEVLPRAELADMFPRRELTSTAMKGHVDSPSAVGNNSGNGRVQTGSDAPPVTFTAGERAASIDTALYVDRKSRRTRCKGGAL